MTDVKRTQRTTPPRAQEPIVAERAAPADAGTAQRGEPAARFDPVPGTATVSASRGDAPRATLTFDGAWGETQSGPLVAGGQLVVSFDPARVQIRHTHNGAPAWGVNAFIKFHPSGELVERPAVQFESIMGRPTNNARSADVVVDIPLGTTSVEIWFRNWTGADRPDERWDSDWGRNYTFPVS